MAKKKKEPVSYECDLCFQQTPFAYAFVVCDKCDDRLRELFPTYKEYRDKIGIDTVDSPKVKNA